MVQPTLSERLAQRQRPHGHPAMFMRWDQLLFLHWVWPAPALQEILPEGLHVDLHEGKAYLGIVPFFMSKVHPRGLPCAPWVSNFPELNVRTYVHDGKGTPGVWFTSLACPQPLAIWAARTFFHLNYVPARMRSRKEDGVTSYRCTRRGQSEAAFRYGMPQRSEVAEPDTLEFFLLERYVLFSADAHGRLYSGRVHHKPYRIGLGTLQDWSFASAQADGFSSPNRQPEHVTMSERVEVEAWNLHAHKP